ncbi:hypothetical protein P8825_15000 [Shouchella clausii]|uniref:hypothetical protein n=1 Tax=Shouchella clausii TaxID=79880 RepID=UPI002DB706B3|nr:hypothetical protein [Shouchella clausii]MEB5480872.1 hypothetical protein [Shouchella clausii]
MKLDYATLSVMIEFIRDEARERNYSVTSVDELIVFLEENPDGFINVIGQGK